MITAIAIFVGLICITLSLILISLASNKEDIWKTIEFKGDGNMACGKKKKGKKK